MSTTDWPTSIVPAAVQWQLQKAGTQFTSPFNGTTQAVDYVAERWQVSLSLPAVRSAGAVAALLNNMAGGVNRVNLWHHGTGGQPAGTLRGSPALGTGAARGDATLTLGSVRVSNNLLLAPQGMAASAWLNLGGCTVQTNIATAPDKTITADTLVESSGTNGGNGHGLRQSVVLTPGTYVLSWYAQSVERTRCTQVAEGAGISDGTAATYNLATGTVSATGSPTMTLERGYWRCTRTIAVSSAGSVTIFISPQDGTSTIDYVGDGSSRIVLWGVQLEQGSSATPYLGNPTLLAGDMIGCSGHLFQVAADCIANDAGAMTVPLVNRVRATIASGTAVTWYRPTAQFIMPAMVGGTMQVPGFTQGAALDLVEVY